MYTKFDAMIDAKCQELDALWESYNAWVESAKTQALQDAKSIIQELFDGRTIYIPDIDIVWQDKQENWHIDIGAYINFSCVKIYIGNFDSAFYTCHDEQGTVEGIPDSDALKIWTKFDLLIDVKIYPLGYEDIAISPPNRYYSFNQLIQQLQKE